MTNKIRNSNGTAPKFQISKSARRIIESTASPKTNKKMSRSSTRTEGMRRSIEISKAVIIIIIIKKKISNVCLALHLPALLTVGFLAEKPQRRRPRKGKEAAQHGAHVALPSPVPHLTPTPRDTARGASVGPPDGSRPSIPPRAAGRVPPIRTLGFIAIQSTSRPGASSALLPLVRCRASPSPPVPRSLRLQL
jgi:hypothetical protein